MNTDLKLSCRDFGEFDLVVVGGGCTGVFAAVRAARLGLKVAIIEKSNCFGGVATNGLVCVWHTLLDVDKKEQIIAGLTQEVEETLFKAGYAAPVNSDSVGISFDPNAMKHVLDKLVVENGVKVFFHTYYNTLVMKDGCIDRIIVGNKDGLGAIRAKFFVDATGDGDLCRDAGMTPYVAGALQPPSPCCFIKGEMRHGIAELVTGHGAEFGLDDDWGWECHLPGMKDVDFRADFHIFDSLCSRADDLTNAEIEGRRKIYALDALLRKYDNPDHAVVALCSHIGIRETVHYDTVFKANERDLLLGKSYEDTVMRGTYRVDIHHQHDNGITFKYLDGRTETFYGKAERAVRGNWREEEGITTPYARYYQAPFRLLVQEQVDNLIPVGRMLNADPGAFGALRVMVNLNQLGEAAGVAAYLAVHQGKAVKNVSGVEVRELLRRGGSV